MHGQQEPLDPAALGTVVVVPVINPTSAARLAAFAALCAVRDGGTVVAVSVLPPEADAAQRRAASVALERAENAARVIGVRTEAVTSVGASVVEALVAVMEDRRATLALMGWQGPDGEGNVFGQLVDALLRRVRVPIVVVRPGRAPLHRITVPIRDVDLAPMRRRSVELVAAVVDRLGVGRGMPVEIQVDGPGGVELPDVVRQLGTVRSQAPAVGQVVTEGGGALVVLHAMPTVEELRNATRQLAAAEAGSWLGLVIEPAATTMPTVAEAVQTRGDSRALPFVPSGEPLLYALQLDVSRGDGRPVDLDRVEDALRDAGASVEVEQSGPDVLLRVELWAISAHAAATRVLSTLHEAEGLADTAITYRVGAAADRLLSRTR